MRNLDYFRKQSTPFCIVRNAKKIATRALLIGALIALSSAYAADKGKPDKQKRSPIDGWDKAKFGMTIHQVQSLYPNSTIETMGCDKSFWRNQGRSPDLDCRTLQLGGAEVAGSLFNVYFYFLEKTGALKSITLSLAGQSDFTDAFVDSTIKNLQAKYGRGQVFKLTEQQTTKRAKEYCDNLLKEPTGVPEWIGNTKWERYLYLKGNGGVIKLSAKIDGVCPNMPDAVREHIKNPSLIMKTLRIEYDRETEGTGQGL
ncbi:hypothetical protein [Cupriavidus sp. IK-TO18]|uniref:hypothetical protein n=1 Tax=Cupriavidus sp. IK-TO18 TaxID=2782182 RepID=UPI00189C36D0|nr:hypothetical protein [Cupriavidus sp. IK-TO18]MBF6986494.1 hypothetical protein [Cupriavidus sp. IK-TO18]